MAGKTPGRIQKYLSLLIVGVVMVVSSLVIMANVLITPERIRNTVVPLVEEYLHCKMNLQGIEVSWYSGVTVSGIELLRGDDGTMILAADKVVLRYQLLPLLMQRVVIDEVRLDHPRVSIERYADGRINIIDLFAGGDKATAPGAVQASSGAGDNDGIDLRISQLHIIAGEVLFKDYNFGRSPYRYSLTDFDLNLTDFSLQDDFSFKLWGKLNGTAIDAEGTVGIPSQRYDVNLVVDSLDVLSFAPYYRQSLPGRVDALKFSIDSRIWGSGASVQAKGRLQLKDVDVTLNAAKSYPVRAKLISLDYMCAYDDQAHRVVLNNSSVEYDGVKVQADGSVVLQPQLQLDMMVALPHWSLRDLGAVLPPQLARSLRQYDLAGTVDAKVHLKGGVDQPMQLVHDGNVVFDAVQASTGGTRIGVDGALNLAGKQLASKGLVVRAGENSVNLDVSCANWLSKRPDIRVNVHAAVVDLNAISSGSNVSAAGDGNASTATVSASEPGPVRLPIDAGGDIVIDKLVKDTIVISGLRTHFELRDNVLEYSGLRAGIAAGIVSGGGSVNLARQGFAYNGSIQARNVDMSQLSSQVLPQYAGKLMGMVNADIKYSGAGTQRLRMQQNLAADGKLAMSNIQVTDTDLLRQLVNLLGSDELRALSFVEGKCDVNLATGGKVTFDSAFTGKRSRIYAVGKCALGGKMDGKVNIDLSKEVMARLDKKGKISQYIRNKDGWGRLPLLLAGPIDSPSLSLDMAAVGSAVADKAVDKLQSKLEKKLGGENSPLSGQSRQLIESTLGGLLGK